MTFWDWGYVVGGAFICSAIIYGFFFKGWSRESAVFALCAGLIYVLVGIEHASRLYTIPALMLVIAALRARFYRPPSGKKG